MMRDLHVEGDGILVSFDVSSLFTSVPVGEAVCFVIHARLREDETLRNRRKMESEFTGASRLFAHRSIAPGSRHKHQMQDPVCSSEEVLHHGYASL